MNISFSVAYGAGLNCWTYGLQSPPCGYMMGIPGGVLLAETDLSRMVEAGSDSRDEYHYLIDVWDYNEHR